MKSDEQFDRFEDEQSDRIDTAFDRLDETLNEFGDHLCQKLDSVGETIEKSSRQKRLDVAVILSFMGVVIISVFAYLELIYFASSDYYFTKKLMNGGKYNVKKI